MDDALKKEILTLIEATELRDYLMEQLEKLNCIQYAEIIAGAPVSLYRKKELLCRLNPGMLPMICMYRRCYTVWKMQLRCLIMQKPPIITKR